MRASGRRAFITGVLDCPRFEAKGKTNGNQYQAMHLRARLPRSALRFTDACTQLLHQTRSQYDRCEAAALALYSLLKRKRGEKELAAHDGSPAETDDGYSGEWTMKTFGRRLRNFRGKATLRDVSIATGISVSYLSEIERDASLPTLKTLQKLADAYETTVALLVSSTRFDDGIERQ